MEDVCIRNFVGCGNKARVVKLDDSILDAVVGGIKRREMTPYQKKMHDMLAAALAFCITPSGVPLTVLIFGVMFRKEISAFLTSCSN